ncbi:MAG: hypothetical protein V1784_07160 [bacterium]
MRGFDESAEAAGTITGGTGVAVKIRGATCVRAAGGTYDITLERGLNAADGIFKAQVRTGAADCNCQIAHTSDTVKRVTTHVGAAAAADQDFDFMAKRISVGVAS